MVKGKSMLHALGHWLGLLHTSHYTGSEEKACSSSQSGDYIVDTPAQSVMNTLACEVYSSLREASLFVNVVSQEALHAMTCIACRLPSELLQSQHCTREANSADRPSSEQVRKPCLQNYEVAMPCPGARSSGAVDSCPCLPGHRHGHQLHGWVARCLFAALHMWPSAPHACCLLEV